MRNLILLSATLLTATAAFAQQSPPATATATIGGQAISVKYSAPSVRGRKIFGEGGRITTDPQYPIWRAGANAATILHTDADLDIAGLAVPKGDYTLFVHVKSDTDWDLVINKQTGQWGLRHDAKQDLGRVKMTVTKPAALVETLKYTITDSGAGKGKLTLEWENVSASVNFTVKK